MEFWGVEVKPGETVKVDPGMEKYLHLSQVSLGEIKKDKGSESVPVHLKFDDQKLVIGTLYAEKIPQIQFDLVFEKEFELSNISKNTSLHFCGYKTMAVEEEDDEYLVLALFPSTFDESDDESDEEAIPLDQTTNGKVEVKNEQAKPAAGKPSTQKSDATAAKPKAKREEPKKDVKPKTEDDDDDDEDDSDDELDLEDDSDDDEEMAEGEDDSSDGEGDASSDEDEDTPGKAKPGNKRSAPSATKTPAPEKKAKLLSPVGSQKSGDGGKKGVHTATPHPAKQGGKTDKSKPQTPKSAGSIVCKSCSRTFNSDKSLQDHSKAKHGAAK